MEVAIGLDLGGTALKSGLVTRSGRVLVARSRPSRAEDGRRGVQAALAEAVEAMRALARSRRARVRALGLGMPGTVSGPAGRVLMSPPQIAGLQGWRAADYLRGFLGVPCAVDNDGTVAGLAESRVGAGQGLENVLTVTVGTGLGGGVVVGGRLVRGRHGTGGEIGHGVFALQGRACSHGGTDCLELYASATALVRIFEEAGGRRGLDPREIARRARRGDRRALAAFRELGTNLGLGLATAATLIAPEVIAVGGGLSAAGRLLLDPARRAFKAQALSHVSRGCRIVRARSGNRAGVIGAALLAWEEGV